MPEFFTVPEAAEVLRIGSRTAYELCRRGELGGAVKVGGQWRIEKAAFNAWVKQGGGSTLKAPKKRKRGKR